MGSSATLMCVLRAGITWISHDAFDGCSSSRSPSITTLIIVSDHAEPRVLTQQQPFDTEAVEQALGFL